MSPLLRPKAPWCARAVPGARVRLLPRSGAALVACALGALASGPVAAVGLGPITQQSALGQSLRVVLPVILATGEELPAECFKLAAAEREVDGVPQLVFGRVVLERTPAGTRLVVTGTRPVNDPVVRLTVQAGCDTAVRREYTLFMDPSPIEPPVVAAETEPRTDAASAQSPGAGVDPVRGAVSAATGAAPAATRAAAPTARTGTRAQRKPAQVKPRASGKTAVPKRPPRVVARQPRLTVSSAAPPAAAGGGAKAPSEAQQERAQRELAETLEAETIVLQQRIIELTALVDRMQQEVRANELAQRAAEETAKAAPPPAPPARAWWEDNGTLLAAIIGLPLLIAAGLLWKRRQAGTRDEPWRVARRTPTGTTNLPAPPPEPLLRNPPAGVAKPETQAVAPRPIKAPPKAPPRDGANALAVSELSQVTEEARVYVALGRPDRAIEVLNEHIRRLPRSMPAAWLMLLDLHHASGRRQEFRRLAEEFHLHFNVQTPLWEAFGASDPGDTGLETFPHIVNQIVGLWHRPDDCREHLEELLYENREGRRVGFPLAAYADILLLLQLIDAPPAVDIDADLANAGKIGMARAGATSAPAMRPATPAGAPARGRKPMPPDSTPAAPGPQRPLAFELDLDADLGKAAKKPPS